MIIKIPIPEENKCLLKVGQHVDFSTPFVEAKSSVDMDIPLAKNLGIHPSKIFRYLKRFVGEKTQKGDVLASKKSLFSNQTIICEHDGMIKEINHNEGVVIISVLEGERNTIPAFFKGEVAEIKKNEISLHVNEAKEFFLKKVSGDFGSEVTYMKNKTEPVIGNAVLHKVLVVESLTPYSQTKAEALGANGFVIALEPSENPNIPYAVLKNANDLKRILESHLPYCLVDKKSSRIYFYM